MINKNILFILLAITMSSSLIKPTVTRMLELAVMNNNLSKVDQLLSCKTISPDFKHHLLHLSLNQVHRRKAFSYSKRSPLKIMKRLLKEPDINFCQPSDMSKKTILQEALHLAQNDQSVGKKTVSLIFKRVNDYTCLFGNNHNIPESNKILARYINRQNSIIQDALQPIGTSLQLIVNEYLYVNPAC